MASITGLSYADQDILREKLGPQARSHAYSFEIQDATVEGAKNILKQVGIDLDGVEVMDEVDFNKQFKPE